MHTLSPGRTAILRIDGELTYRGRRGGAAEWQDADLTEVTSRSCPGISWKSTARKARWYALFIFQSAASARVRIQTAGRDAMSVRLHPAGVPMPEKLLLPEEITELVKNGRGLLLVTGGRGSGVTTTVASLAAQIAATQSKVIVSVEGYDRIHPSAGEGDWLCSGRSERTALPGRKPLR